jgi:hypothetical protein
MTRFDDREGAGIRGHDDAPPGKSDGDGESSRYKEDVGGRSLVLHSRVPASYSPQLLSTLLQLPLPTLLNPRLDLVSSIPPSPTLSTAISTYPPLVPLCWTKAYARPPHRPTSTEYTVFRRLIDWENHQQHVAKHHRHCGFCRFRFCPVSLTSLVCRHDR